MPNVTRSINAELKSYTQELDLKSSRNKALLPRTARRNSHLKILKCL